MIRMNNEITNFLKSVRDSLLSISIVLVLYGLVERFLLPKQTKIIVDDGVPAELTVLGKKGNPKAVYVSSKKNRINFRGAVFFCLAANILTKLIQKYEEEHKVSIKED